MQNDRCLLYALYMNGDISETEVETALDRSIQKDLGEENSNLYFQDIIKNGIKKVLNVEEE